MNVLSLCDGMSCGHIALERAGIKVDKYFAAEIKDIAIKVTKENYPDTICIGDVNKISFRDGVLYTEKGSFEVGNIDLVIFGSPCQTFSIAMKTDLRVGLENKEKSGLFLECYRILKEVNPTYFLMENVARMKKEDKQFISEMMSVEPIRINSSLVSAQLRDRFYWTNIPNVTIPEDKQILFQEILTSGYTDRKKAFEFFMKFANADCEKICIENPIGYPNTHYKKPDQIIQPWMFGHPFTKGTCLWLKGLEPLTPFVTEKPDNLKSYAWETMIDERGKTISWNSELSRKLRSKTFEGIAKAMAEQWG